MKGLKLRSMRRKPLIVGYNVPVTRSTRERL